MPLLIVHPGQPEPRRVSRLVETVDLAPTLAEMSGLPEFTGASGRSLVGLIQTAAEDRLRVKKALEVYGDVRDSDYYTFSVRYEAIEQAYRGLVNDPGGMHPKG